MDAIQIFVIVWSCKIVSKFQALDLKFFQKVATEFFKKIFISKNI